MLHNFLLGVAGFIICVVLSIAAVLIIRSVAYKQKSMNDGIGVGGFLILIIYLILMAWVSSAFGLPGFLMGFIIVFAIEAISDLMQTVRDRLMCKATIAANKMMADRRKVKAELGSNELISR